MPFQSFRPSPVPAGSVLTPSGRFVDDGIVWVAFASEPNPALGGRGVPAERSARRGQRIGRQREPSRKRKPEETEKDPSARRTKTYAPKRLMRILRPIIEAATDLLPICGADLIHRRRIRAKPVGDDLPRCAVFLHDPLQKLQRRSLVDRDPATPRWVVGGSISVVPHKGAGSSILASQTDAVSGPAETLAIPVG